MTALDLWGVNKSTNLPFFFLLFLLLYFFAYFLVFRNWGPKHRAEACSCFISLFHGTPAMFLAALAITTQAPTLPSSPRSFAARNTGFQNSILEYSIAYFLTDLLHYIVFFPNDILFICHHLATLYVFVTCRCMVHHGAYALLLLLILAEVTSACQNVWSIAGYQRESVPAAKKLYEVLSPVFYAVYTVVRGILGPLVVGKIVWSYQSGFADDLIPRWMWVSWVIVIVTAILVSILWVLKNWVVWYKERNYEASKKVA